MKRKVIFFLLVFSLMGLTFFNIAPVKAVATYYYDGWDVYITGSTANFAGWYSADQAGGWGTIGRSSSDDYYLDSNYVFVVYIGNSTDSCTFYDYSKQVDFDGVYWTIANGSTLKFGRVQAGKARDGVQVTGNIQIHGEAGSNIELYAVTIQRGQLITEGTSIIQGCIFDGMTISPKDTDLTYTVLNNAYFRGLDYEVSGLINNVYTWASYLFIITWDYNVSISNVVTRPSSYLMGTFGGQSWVGEANLTNVESTTWAMDWNGVSDTGKIWRKYTYDLTVTYPNGTHINGTSTGARVLIQHYGQGGGIDYNATLGEDGKIPMQNLTMGFYNSTGGDSLYSWNNYNLRIYNVTGYAEYNGNFTLSGKTSLTVVLYLPSGYAGFVFLFLGLVIGLVVGALLGYGSKK